MNSFFIFYSYSILLLFLLLTIECDGFWFKRKYYKKEDEALSSLFTRYVNRKINPCNNFYKYSCGKWLNETKLYGGEKIINQFSYSENKFKRFLREAGRGKYNDDSPAIKKINQIKVKCLRLYGYWRSKCFEKITSGFGLYPLVSYFLHKEFVKNKDTRGNYRIVKDIFKNLKREFKILLNEKDNMLDRRTKNNFIEKVDHMEIDTSILILLSNLKAMEECYKFLVFSKDNTFKTIYYKIRYFLIRLLVSGKSHLRTCFKIIMNHRILRFGVLANAAYLVEYNEIVVTPLLLDKPIFSPDYPMSFNYGSIGFILGHEIIHGFDNIGIHYDYEGDFNRRMISYKTKMKYQERADCLENQYSEEVHEKLNKNIDGRLTLRENIADNGAIKLAHRAFMKYLKSIGGKEVKSEEYKNYTDEQLFFINFGKTFCEKIADEYVKENLRNDEHSPGEIRVTKTLSNYRPFSRAFKCKIGENMNPIDKCEVWM